jgi:hypothetical protein
MTQFFSTQWTRVSTVAAITLVLAPAARDSRPRHPRSQDKPATPAGSHRQRHTHFARRL